MVDPIKALITLKMEGKHEIEVPLTALYIVDSMASKHFSFQFQFPHFRRFRRGRQRQRHLVDGGDRTIGDSATSTARRNTARYQE